MTHRSRICRACRMCRIWRKTAIMAGLTTMMAMGAAGGGDAEAQPKAEAKAAPKAAGKTRGAPRTVFVPSPNNPLVALRVFFHVGSADDPSGKEGLAALTSDVVGQGGTRQRTYAE